MQTPAGVEKKGSQLLLQRGTFRKAKLISWWPSPDSPGPSIPSHLGKVATNVEQDCIQEAVENGVRVEM